MFIEINANNEDIKKAIINTDYIIALHICKVRNRDDIWTSYELEVDFKTKTMMYQIEPTNNKTLFDFFEDKLK